MRFKSLLSILALLLLGGTVTCIAGRLGTSETDWSSSRPSRYVRAFEAERVGTTSSGSSLTPYDLQVERRSAPLGVNAEAPRFSWDLQAEERAQHQTAYRIRVASSREELQRGTADVWDTGRVKSTRSHLISYDGSPLKPSRTYYWTVKVWGAEGDASAWSAPSSWTMGRMGEWGGAQWVGTDTLGRRTAEMRPHQLPLFRRAFELQKPVRSATLHATGLGFYELYVNGEKASKNVLSPGWTDYAESVLYNTYEVTDLLQDGNNVIGMSLGHGMYHIPGGREDGRYAKFYDSYGAPKFIAFLRVTHPDGSETTIVSNNSWQASGGPVTFSSIWGGEDYDARLEKPGWRTPGVDSAAWVDASVMKAPGGRLKPQSNPPLQVQTVHPSVEITEPEDGVYVYDFGQNLSGWPRLRIRGAKGDRVTLRPAEVLGEDGLVNQTSMKHSGDIFFSYTLDGRGMETWRPQFTYTGFRYLQVEGATRDPGDAGGRPLLLGVESQFVHANARKVGHFASSDSLLNGIHEIIQDAIRSNMKSVMTDCPHREKLGWLEQSYLNGPGVLFNYDTGPLYAKWVDDMAQAQTDRGLVPDIAPEYTVFDDGFRDSPEWGSAFILTSWMAYRQFGSKRALQQHYGDMKRYANYLAGKASNQILSYGLGDWYDIGPDSPGHSQLTSKGVTATATYYEDLRVLSQIAEVLGRPEDHRLFKSRADDVQEAFNETFFNPDTGVYDTGSQTAQAIPLALDLVPEGQKEAVLGHLVEDVRKRGMHTTAGDIGHRYVLLSLMDAGRSDLIYEMATNPEPPSYAALLASGATTLTEAWDADPHSSQNHFMLGHIEEWFYKGLGGIRPHAEGPGFRRVVIDPTVLDSLDWAEVEYESVRGPISSQWQRTEEEIKINVSIPPGTTGNVHIPARAADAVQEGGTLARKATGVSFLYVRDGRPVFEVESGSYQFTAPLGGMHN